MFSFCNLPGCSCLRPSFHVTRIPAYHVTINQTDFGTSGDRGSRGEDPQKPAVRIAHTWDGSPLRRAGVRPVQKTGCGHRKQETQEGYLTVLKNAVSYTLEARDFSRESFTEKELLTDHKL